MRMKIPDYIEYKWANDPETCVHRYLVPAIIGILKKLKLNVGSRILDVGCGGGALVNRIYNIGFMNIWGIDASQSGVSLARASFPKIADRFFKHNAYESKLPNSIPERYDLIISMEVIEHLYSPETYLGNLYKWLNDDGYLIITSPYHGYLKNLLILFANKFEKHFNPLVEGGHIKFFSTRSLSALLHKRRFEVLKVKYIGRIPWIWKSMIFIARKT